MTDHITDSSKKVPPCPVCGVVPIMSIYQSENRIDRCKCIQWPIPCTQEYWGLWCDEAIGRHTRANLGITTIAQLNELLAPDPRAAVLEAERDAAITMLAKWIDGVDRNGSNWDGWDHYYKTAKYSGTPIRELIDAKLKQIAAQRGEGV